MKLIRCIKNKTHYYDGDKYAECPHCIRESGKKTAEVPAEVVSARNVSLVFPSKQEASKTESAWMQSHRGSVGRTESLITRGNSKVSSEEDMNELQQPAETVDLQPPKELSHAPAGGSLQEAVDTVKRPVITDDTKTIAFYDIADEEPVVGWLVCLKGAYTGEGFALKTGRNTIGRSLKMGVPLAKELSISRDCHAVITYEPINRKFYIQAGESGGLTYVNKELILIPRELNGFDIVQLGKSEFIFCALCGPQFTWDDYV